ncbi:hypothetical protein JW826_05255 [Candidatus Woesearchaeota archaeon]|nr:hypothetical protein [Candidatus Woesearchaeota archaeon]
MEKKYMKAMFSLTLVLGLLLSGVWFVFGVQAPSAIIQGASSRMNQSYAGTGSSLGAQAGNVTHIDLAGTQVTTHWAGFYGNISGNITLEDSSGAVFYDWTGLGTPVGEVYASNTSTVTWSSIACANADNMTGLDTFLGMTATDADSVYNTYGSPTHGGFSVAGTTITADTCNSTNAYVNSALNAAYFSQVLLADGNNVPVFGTLLNSSATAFNGAQVDFQLLTGVPGTGTLYFFIELG